MNAITTFFASEQTLFLCGSILVQVTVIFLLVLLTASLGGRRRAPFRHTLLLSGLISVALSPCAIILLQRQGLILAEIPVLWTSRTVDGNTTVSSSSMFPGNENTTEEGNRDLEDSERQFSSRDALVGEQKAAEAEPHGFHTKIGFDDPHNLSDDHVAIPIAIGEHSNLQGLSASAGSPSDEYSRSGIAGLVLILVWSVGLLVSLFRIVAGWRGISRLEKTAQAVVTRESHELLKQACEAVGLRRIPRLAVSSMIPVPVATGLLHPRILLPESVYGVFSAEKLRSVLVHECAHLVRRDHWIGILQRFVGALCWFHPLSHLLNRRLDRAREEICDNYVLNQGHGPSYAQTLLQIAEGCSGRTVQMAAPALWEPAWNLEQRITDLLVPGRLTLTKMNRGVAGGIVGGFLCLSVLIGSIRFVQAAPKNNKLPDSADRNEASNEKTRQAKISEENPIVRRDAYGDPLPPGAIARIGRLHLRPGNEVRDVAISPDSSLIAVASSWGSSLRRNVQLWDARTGKLVREMKGHAGGIRSVAFSPLGDLLASGGEDWTVRIWDVKTGEQLQLLRTHRFGLHGLVHGIRVAFTPDGEVISGGHEGAVQVWDADTGDEIIHLRPERTVNAANRLSDEQRVRALAVSPDGETVAVVSIDKKIRLWNIFEDALPPKIIEVELSRIRNLAFSPDGQTLAWCGKSRLKSTEGIFLLDMKTSKTRLRLLGNKNGNTFGIAFSPDGTRIVSAGDGQTIKMWDTQTGKELWTTTGHTDNPWTVAYSPDGKFVVSGARDGSMQIWNAKTGEDLLPRPEEYTDQIMAMSLAADGQSVLIVGKDRKVRVMDLNSSRIHRQFRIDQEVRKAAFSEDNRLVAIGDYGTVGVWDVESGERRWSHSGFKNQQTSAAIDSPRVRQLAFSRDGRYLASTSFPSREQRSQTVVRIWDTTTGKLLTIIDHPAAIWAAPIFSFNGDTLTLIESMSSGKRITNRQILVYETTTGTLFKKIKSDIFASSSAVSPDGKFLATGSGSDRIRFWDIENGDLQFTLQGPRAGMVSKILTFSPDGKKIAGTSSHFSEFIHVWDIDRGTLTHEFRGPAQTLVYSADGNRLISGQQDGTMLVWDLTAPNPTPLRKLTRAEIEARWKRKAHGLDSSIGNYGNDERTNALVEGGDDTVDFLEETLLNPRLPFLDNVWIEELTAPLSDPDPTIRKNAVEEIIKFGDDAYLATKNLKAAPATAIEQARVEQVLLKILQYRRSSHGSLDVLRQIATPKALRLLKILSEGPENTLEQNNRKVMAGSYLNDLKKLKLKRTK